MVRQKYYINPSVRKPGGFFVTLVRTDIKERRDRKTENSHSKKRPTERKFA